jgi:hypothetical protein
MQPTTSNFLSAEELKIDDWEHAGLVEVMRRLERGELRHIVPEHERHSTYQTPDGFNMAFDGVGVCGTVACIGGWVARTKGMRAEGYVPNIRPGDPLDPLYYPLELGDLRAGTCPWYKITTEQAAAAIRNFLTTGAPRWLEVVGA